MLPIRLVFLFIIFVFVFVVTNSFGIWIISCYYFVIIPALTFTNGPVVVVEHFQLFKKLFFVFVSCWYLKMINNCYNGFPILSKKLIEQNSTWYLLSVCFFSSFQINLKIKTYSNLQCENFILSVLIIILNGFK